MTSPDPAPTDRGAHDHPPLPPCPDCGTESTPGGRFCRACGSPLAATDPGGGRPFGTDDGDATPPEAGNTGELPAVRPSSEVELDVTRRACQNCGAPNSALRELCGRCGADLDTGELTARPEPRPYPPLSSGGPDGDEVRRWLAPLAAVLGVAALLVLGLVVAGLGPFDRGPQVVETSFEQERYPDDPQRLSLSDIATLSALPDQGEASFAPTQMVDDDPATAWNSDGGGDGPPQGVGEQIDIVFSAPAWVDRLVLANGDQRDPDTYAANARVKRAQLTFDGGITFVVNLLDEGLGEQAVEFRQPVLTTAIRIEVLEVFPGDTHPDLAISDLAFEGWPADAEDAAVAAQMSRPATGSAP